MSVWKDYWVSISWWTIRKTTWLVWLSVIGMIIIAVFGLYLYMHSLPSLNIWHTLTLKNEFTKHTRVKDFKSYLALEERLFNELDDKIYDKNLTDTQNHINRYAKGSIADPERWKPNWNRSFELPVKDPKMGVLLLHGMSDSPYSLHTQAELLHEKGVYVVAMRMPGHGTIPSGLVKLKWEDMAAVVKIGMRRLAEKLGDEIPIHIIGYSTGATLALNYTFEALSTETLPLPKKLIFYSPAIGLSFAAPFAIWQSRAAHLLGLKKLEWNSIGPEYDPFKYNSFAVNAGDQVYQLCDQIKNGFKKYKKNNQSKRAFPDVLSFVSIVDATVSVPAVLNSLYDHLPKGNHTAVLFDLNHHFSNALLVKESILKNVNLIRQHPLSANYHFDLVSDINNSEGNLTLIRDHSFVKTLPLQWPKEQYSLSHVSLPFSPKDPLYGGKDAAKSPGIQLGHLAIYGETSILQLSAASMLRQRWNPFHTYINKRLLEFLELSEEASN